MKRKKFVDAVAILAVSAAVSTFGICVGESWRPRIEDYVFNVPSGINVESYLVRDRKLYSLDRRTEVSDRDLEAAIANVFRHENERPAMNPKVGYLGKPLPTPTQFEATISVIPIREYVPK